MVPDPRAAGSHHRLRPLNQPRTVLVEVDPSGRPAAVTLRDRRVVVQQVLDCWRIDDEWWRERPLSRLYWQVALEDGRPITIFIDLIECQWWRQSY